MMTDESVVEWALGWVRDNTDEDPALRERFAEGLRQELAQRRAELASSIAKEREVCATLVAQHREFGRLRAALEAYKADLKLAHASLKSVDFIAEQLARGVKGA